MEQVILSIAGEGGGITILGRSKADESGWEFARQTRDHSMAMLGTGPGEEGEPNPDYVPPPLEWVGTWGEAIGLIDRYPWVMLHPVDVHPDFRELVLVEVTRRLTGEFPKYAFSPPKAKSRAMDRWLEKCK